jgi:hypothetical protein
MFGGRPRRHFFCGLALLLQSHFVHTHVDTVKHLGQNRTDTQQAAQARSVRAAQLAQQPHTDQGTSPVKPRLISALHPYHTIHLQTFWYCYAPRAAVYCLCTPSSSSLSSGASGGRSYSSTALAPTLAGQADAWLDPSSPFDCRLGTISVTGAGEPSARLVCKT